jgi:hypothetical protein
MADESDHRQYIKFQLEYILEVEGELILPLYLLDTPSTKRRLTDH